MDLASYTAAVNIDRVFAFSNGILLSIGYKVVDAWFENAIRVDLYLE